MRTIYSKVDEKVLLCAIHSLSRDRRENLSNENEPLQVSVLVLDKDSEVLPHAHLPVHREIQQTQECWVVIYGFLSVQIYDIDDVYLNDVLLGPGDVFVYFNGGHGFRTNSEAKIVEIKNGPYFGADRDYRRINVEN